ncbi:MAG: Transposase Tn5 dimerization domain [Myxococcaceae bacterium]|nr:Transposase Tn5 dimerization domain [Myxococcaceae bacterium]
MPSIATAVRWLAHIGGFQGKPTSSPGAITIGRGLERLIPFVLGLEAGMKLAKK